MMCHRQSIHSTAKHARYSPFLRHMPACGHTCLPGLALQYRWCGTALGRFFLRVGDMLVRTQPLAAVAAVARRRSSLRPIGLELFMISPGLEPHLQQQLGQLSGPFWDAPSAFFTFRCAGADPWGVLSSVAHYRVVLCLAW